MSFHKFVQLLNNLALLLRGALHRGQTTKVLILEKPMPTKIAFIIRIRLKLFKEKNTKCNNLRQTQAQAAFSISCHTILDPALTGPVRVCICINLVGVLQEYNSIM